MGDPIPPRTRTVNIRPRPAPKIEDLLLLAWWLHARSRIPSGLRRRDTVEVQQCGLHEKMDLQQTLDGATFWLDHGWGSVAAVLGSWRWLLGLYFFLLCGDCDWIMTLQACGVRGDRSEGLRRREGLCDSVREAGGQFCKYARGGSNKIRDLPAPGIGAIYITRNCPVTSLGRGGSGRVGSDRAKIAIPNCGPILTL